MASRIMVSLIGLIVITWLALSWIVAPRMMRQWEHVGKELSGTEIIWANASMFTIRHSPYFVIVAVALVVLPWTYFRSRVSEQN